LAPDATIASTLGPTIGFLAKASNFQWFCHISSTKPTVHDTSTKVHTHARGSLAFLACVSAVPYSRTATVLPRVSSLGSTLYAGVWYDGNRSYAGLYWSGASGGATAAAAGEGGATGATADDDV
jgi:hypothetical protein